MMKTKYLIIGGGITGLSAASRIKNEDYCIFEKESRVGGYCKTEKRGKYIWDYAGHFFHFKSSHLRALFKDSFDANDLIERKKNTKIIYNGKYIDYPFQKNIHQLPKKEFVSCLYDLYFKEEKAKYDNFIDMLYGKFGKSIVEKFLVPYNEKLYACKLDNLDVDAMGRFFPYVDVTDVIKSMKNQDNSSYNDYFFYPKQGAEAFINILSNNLNKNKIFCNEEIIHIDKNNHLAYTSKNNVIEYKYLINTSPLNNFLNILDEENTIRNNLTYNKVLVFNIGFKHSSNNDEHWLYIPDRRIGFYRIGFYNNILKNFELNVYVEIGFNMNENIDVDYWYNRTLDELEKMEISKNNKVVDYNYFIMNPAYVHINKNTQSMVNKFLNTLEKNNIYSIGRYGSWTYCSMEDCMIQAHTTIDKIEEKGD